MNVIRKEEVLPLFINHLSIQGQEEIFCCNKEIPCIDVSKEVALLTEKYLPEGSMYHYGKEYYQFARLFFNKRIHCCEQNDEKESKKSREERIEQVKAEICDNRRQIAHVRLESLAGRYDSPTVCQSRLYPPVRD